MSRLGAKVIIGSRNVEKSKKAAQEIQDETGREVIALALDLASFESVQKFAKEVLSIRCVMFEPTDINSHKIRLDMISEISVNKSLI